MPSILFHYTFTNQVAKSEKYQDVLNLAAQGTDVFGFYGYNFVNRKDKKIIRRFGMQFHHSDASSAFFYLLEYAKTSPYKEMLETYCYGNFTHYILDRNLHPYIFYRTGFDETGNAGGIYFVSHVTFESYLDVKLAKRFNTLQNPLNAVKTRREYVKEISKMYYYASKRMGFEGLKEDSFYIAYKDMLVVQTVLYSRLGIKKALFNLFLNKSLVNAMSLPLHSKKYDYIDFLNDSKLTWKYPATGEESNLSVVELMDKAKEEIRDLDHLFELYNKDLLTINDISKFVKEIDHDGNNYKALKKYSNICWNTLNKF